MFLFSPSSPGHRKIVFQLKEVFVLKSIATADSLYKSLQQYVLTGRPLVQNQQKVTAVSDAQLRQNMLVVPKEN